MPPRPEPPVALGAGGILLSQLSQNAGAALAKHLFGAVGPEGVAALRFGIAATLLLLVLRPWRRPVPRASLLPLLCYGASLGGMGLSIYFAFARIPIGLAVAIEVTGPLTIVLLGARRPLDFAWFGIAALGLALLLPSGTASALDPVGVLFAAGAALCWALYVVFAGRLAAPVGRNAVAWGMAIAALVIVPLGVGSAGPLLLQPAVLLTGIGVAVLASAIPYVLEIAAIEKLPPRLVGMFLSTGPAVAALVGFVALGEHLAPAQWLAIGCIVLAAAGSAWTVRRAPAPAVSAETATAAAP